MHKLLALLLITLAAKAQKPPSYRGYIGSPIDYTGLSGGYPYGDNYYFSAWAANSMLPFFPDPTGLPILGWPNDGTTTACTGYVMGTQLSKIPGLLTAPSYPSNILLTMFPAPCFGIQANGSGGWNGELTGPPASYTLGTWKGPSSGGYFRTNRLLMPIYRQNSPGTIWGDSTLLLSPDLLHYVDQGTYNVYPVTAATCASNVITLTTTTNPSALIAGQLLYAHDITGGTWYNGMQTVVSSNSTQITYSKTCTNGSGTVGADSGFGLLQDAGIIPKGPGDASYPGSMMWVVSAGSNPMTWQMIFDYGQDGSFSASGVDAACDPTVYVCGTGSDRAIGSDGPMILWRVPVGKEMIKSAYQFYTCPGYNVNWPSVATTCDGNLAGSWTSTIGSATTIRRHKDVGYDDSGDCFHVKYYETHQSYIMTCDTFAGSGYFSYMWAPRPWGPWYPLAQSTAPMDATNWAAFNSAMSYGENKASSTPPLSQVHVSNMTGYGYHVGSGTANFWGLEFGSGRVPPLGMARRADFLGTAQAGVGHRFCVSGGWSGGCIPRSGLAVGGGTYKLDWWVDAMDYAGFQPVYKPYIRDLLTNGDRYFTALSGSSTIGFTGSFIPVATGIDLTDTVANVRLGSSFTDTAMSANSGNGDYTAIFAYSNTHPSGLTCGNGSHMVGSFGRELPLLTMGNGAATTTVSFGVSCGSVTWRNGSDDGTKFATNIYITDSATPLAASAWNFIAISVQHSASGMPVVMIYLADPSGGFRVYGPVATGAANNTTTNGLTKNCGTIIPCATTPNVSTGQAIYLGGLTTGQTQSQQGVLGEGAVLFGALPENTIRSIYKTIQADWLRTGRGVL